MDNETVNIIQISDIHLNLDKTKDLLGVKTHDSFQAVINHIKNKKELIELIILTGDLSQDGSPEAYRRIAEMLDPLGVPVYTLPGNHDNLMVMEQVYPCGNLSRNKHIVLDSWQIILLDSHTPGKVEGFLAEDQLSYLQQCLRLHPELHAIVSFHHHPVPVGCVWLDNLGVKNADAFWAIASTYPQIKQVLFGHVHQEFEQQVNEIRVYSSPSTCIQFMRCQDTFELDNLPPGYRVVKLHPDGRFETHVERIEKYIGFFDRAAKGY